MKAKTILISGAGIAGPALAYWLVRQGHRVTVVERSRSLRTGGQAVDLRGAGRTVVERMDLMDQVLGRALDQRGIAWVAADGRFTATMPVDAFGGEGIISEIEILRGDLGEVLYNATATGTEYRFGDSILGIDQDADGVNVAFEKSDPERFDLVVGADGLRSVVRELAFGTGAQQLHPLGCITAWFTAPEVPDLDGWYLMHNIPGGMVASVRPGRIADESKAGLSFRSPTTFADHMGADQAKELFAAKFSGLGWRIPFLLEAMRSAPDFAFESLDQVHLDHWSTGRVVLLGDAGYCPTPLTGLGTSLALVGAYVLAGELTKAEGDYGRAFDRYEQVLRPYVKKCQQLPPGGVRGFAPASSTAIHLQALSMRSMTRWPMRKLLAGQFAKAGQVDLPDYARRTTGIEQ
jgi:2-polyprenyl-6-methoxyphenol hydroxylase-like FAD-dependent oxidoreductase